MYVHETDRPAFPIHNNHIFSCVHRTTNDSTRVPQSQQEELNLLLRVTNPVRHHATLCWQVPRRGNRHCRPRLCPIWEIDLLCVTRAYSSTHDRTVTTVTCLSLHRESNSGYVRTKDE